MKLPPDELTWLYTHCRAIGMTCKSDSGKWEHDISLFTTLQKDRIVELEARLEIDPRTKYDGIDCRDTTIKELEAQLAAQAGQEPVMKVSLPERVVDCLWQQVGISTYHPDGDQLEKLQEFAVLVKDEVLARLTTLRATPTTLRYVGWRYAEMPLEIRLSVVNGASTPQWNAISNKSQRIVISQKTPQEALRLALIGAGYAGAEPQLTDKGGQEQIEVLSDEIVTALYRRFKEWSKRGFSADDVTWCEVKADVIALVNLHKS